MIIISRLPNRAPCGAPMWRAHCPACGTEAIRVGGRKIIERGKMCGSCSKLAWWAAKRALEEARDNRPL